MATAINHSHFEIAKKFCLEKLTQLFEQELLVTDKPFFIDKFSKSEDYSCEFLLLNCTIGVELNIEKDFRTGSFVDVEIYIKKEDEELISRYCSLLEYITEENYLNKLDFLLNKIKRIYDCIVT